MKFQHLDIGSTVTRTRTVTDEMIQAFANIMDDFNPIHVDDSYAASTSFGQRIAHGMIVAGLVSATLANDLPGPGTVYLGQTLKFKAPVYPGETITATVEVKSVRLDKPIATLTTTCTKQDGTLVLEGEAVVLFS